MTREVRRYLWRARLQRWKKRVKGWFVTPPPTPYEQQRTRLEKRRPPPPPPLNEAQREELRRECLEEIAFLERVLDRYARGQLETRVAISPCKWQGRIDALRHILRGLAEQDAAARKAGGAA